MDSKWSPWKCGGECKVLNFGWTMISFGKIYPCRSVIVSTLILAHFFTAFLHYYKLMQLYLQTNTFCRAIYLQAHILFFLILAESLKSVIHNEKNHYYFNYVQHRQVQHR